MAEIWKEELAGRITEFSKISSLINADDTESCTDKKMMITPHIFRLISDKKDYALIKQFIPLVGNCDVLYPLDYLNESPHQPVPNLIHKYPNKVAIIACNECACYCQFCTRQRVTNSSNEFSSELGINRIASYIKDNPNIVDVLITGGDPLVLDTQYIKNIINKISSISTVKVIRIGTRVPITLPSRIDDELLDMLKAYNNLYINIHVNHPSELSFESRTAILKLANSGIPLGSQTVLLKGVNDNEQILKSLFEALISIKVKPYYLYQCDKVRGCEDFIINPIKFIDIINNLCGEISGFALPRFVIDTPEAGKLSIAPNNIKEIRDNKIIFVKNGIEFMYDCEGLL